MLEAHDLAEIRTLLRSELCVLRPTEIIQTTAEAVAYTKSASAFAFYRWAKKWRCQPVANGRWPTRRIDAALDREQRSAASRKPGSGRRSRILSDVTPSTAAAA